MIYYGLRIYSVPAFCFLNRRIPYSTEGFKSVFGLITFPNLTSKMSAFKGASVPNVSIEVDDGDFELAKYSENMVGCKAELFEFENSIETVLFSGVIESIDSEDKLTINIEV